MGRLEGIEPLLGPVDVLTRPGLLVLVDLGLRPGADDMRDRIRAEQDQAAVVDLERVTVERTHRRPGDAVSLGVVLTAVARTAVAGRNDRGQIDPPVLGVLDDVRLSGELLPGRAVRLDRTTEMGA